MSDASSQPSTTVHDAATAGDVARLAQLVAADPGAASTPGPDGWTPLHLAAHYGRTEAVRLLLERGANVRAVSANATANTPLHAGLAGAADAVIVDLLLAHGADPGAPGGGGWTPLHLAASRGAAPFVRRLLEAGADPRAAADDGRDAAAIARERGHPEIAALLEG